MPYAYIQNTTVYVGARAVRSEVLDAEECGRRWSQTKQVVAAIIEGSDWSPNPSPLCEWCPFVNGGCSLTVEDGDDDDLGQWLDGTTDQRSSEGSAPSLITFLPQHGASDAVW